ncbi:MAG: hypothetical protein H6Q89_439 [Myxococcaceae bacterium]|nr:hypothetical protein [Myxococcaceae bacterium]
MRALPRTLAAGFTLFLLSCGQMPLPGKFEPTAKFPPPSTKVTPPPGPFNGEVELTFTTELPATIFVSLDGADPRTTSKGRIEGPSPLKLKLTQTTEVKYFASVGGRDEELQIGKWLRAGPAVGTISGVVVVGDFGINKLVGVTRNAQTVKLTKPTKASELPFTFTGLQAGPHRLQAILDRDDDGQLIPFLDFQSMTETITLDFKDPYKASAENVRLYLGSSPPELCTIAGTITLPNAPLGQNLQISAISPDGFLGGADPQALLTQLQGGYRIFTNPGQTEYPYVITDLKPGRYVPVPLLLGFGVGGVAMNFLANPLRTVNCVAGETAVSDHAFGPLTMNGTAVVKPPSAPSGAFNYGVVAAKSTSLITGIQAVMMPVVFARDATTMELSAAFGAQALRTNSTFSVRVFVNGAIGSTAGNPIVDAMAWVINPFAPQPAHATVNMTNVDQTVTVTVP